MKLLKLTTCSILILFQLAIGALTNGSSSNQICTNYQPSQNHLRIDCNIEDNLTEEKCVSRGCCWHQHNGQSDCYWPVNFQDAYNISMVEEGSDLISLVLKRKQPSGLPKDIDQIGVKIYQLTDTMVRIRITDLNNKRYEPPLPILKIPKRPKSSPLYNVSFSLPWILTITRLSTGRVLFQTDLSKLIFTDQFHQLTTKLPTDHFYGLGERRDVFRKKVTNKKYTLFNRDHYPAENINLYGSHPFHFSIEDSHGHAAGTFLLNSNAMDVLTSNQLSLPTITYRPIGGILDFFIFVEDSAEDLVKSYVNLIGLPPMPPLWSLGFHLCKWGYNTLNETIKVWNRTRNAQIPFDTQWNDIDYMKDYNDFTYDQTTFAGLPEFVDQLHQLGMRYVVILDPGVDGAPKPGTYPPYEDGLKMNVFIKNATGQVLVARTWNWSNKTVYPDFTHPNSTKYWTKQVQSLYNQFKFDGLWIDMNEIATIDSDGSLDGCPKSTLDDPPYRPGDVPLKTKTICMSAKQHLGNYYDLKNLYASYEAIATETALNTVRPGKRQFVMSRASFPGLGHHSTHWDGDVVSDWPSMKWTVTSIMEINLFGIPMVGSDICGFNGDTTVEMCARWSQLGAFYPFSRNHNSNGSIDQDPASLGEVVVKANQVAQDLRYRLLPYLYTLFYRAHIYGETVARPLFFVFKDDQTARRVDTEFMWGDGLLIAPVLDQGATSVNAYLPADKWYFVDDHKVIESTGQYFEFETPIDKNNVLLRGGKVIAMADKKLLTTTELHTASFKILAGLDSNGTASGELYWDDGESLNAYENGNYNLVKFEVANQTLKSTPVKVGYHFQKKLSSVVIQGVVQRPSSVSVNGKPVKFTHNGQKEMLTISLRDQNCDIFDLNLVSWN